MSKKKTEHTEEETHEEGGVEVPDTDEETGMTSMVGTLAGRWVETEEDKTKSTVVHAASSSGTSGIGSHLPGLYGPGITTSPPFAPVSPPGFPSPGWGTTTTTTTLPGAKVKRKPVRLPSRFTEKVLLAFLDEENDDPKTNVVWAQNLLPMGIELVKEEDGELRLQITFSMEDVYNNNDDE